MDPFDIRPRDQTYVFIDGGYLFAACRGNGFDLDFKRFRDHLRENCDLRIINYYAMVRQGEGGQFQSARPLLDWLSYNGFRVYEKPLVEVTDPDGRRKVTGDPLIEMSVDIALTPPGSHIIVASRNGELAYALDRAARNHCRITLLTNVRVIRGDDVPEEAYVPPPASDILRRHADVTVDVHSIRESFGKPARGAEVRNERPTGTLRMPPRR